MVLSGVARTQARFPCGKTLIAQMLCGSGNAKMSKLRLDKLSTFGLLQTPQAVGGGVDDRCARRFALPGAGRAGAISARGATDGVRQRSDEGQSIAQRRAAGAARPVAEIAGPAERGRWKRESGERAGSPSPSSFSLSENRSDDAELLKSLRRWRQEISDEAGVPPHYIFSNDTLGELVRCRPTTCEELLSINGIGPVKAGRLGSPCWKSSLRRTKGRTERKKEERRRGKPR